MLCLAFPLHLPGRPERSRLPELLTADRAAAGAAGNPGHLRQRGRAEADLAAADAGDEVVVVPLPGADHGFKTPAGAEFRPADLRALLVASTAA